MSTEDQVLLARLVAGMRRWSGIVARSSEGSRLLQLDGVVATVAPAVPERSVVNSVMYDDAGRLEAAHEQLAAAYDAAGVRAWTVWVPPGDDEAKRLLAARGHELDAEPAAMARSLEGFERPAPGMPEDWTADGDVAVAAELSDRAFGLDTDSFTRAFATMPRHEVGVYLAQYGGEPAACVITSDHEGNCAVDMVGVVPEARGHGLSGKLISQALADAVERRCTTTSLVATKIGRPVYERLGYRDLGPVEMWELRA